MVNSNKEHEFKQHTALLFFNNNSLNKKENVAKEVTSQIYAKNACGKNFFSIDHKFIMNRNCLNINRIIYNNSSNRQKSFKFASINVSPL